MLARLVDPERPFARICLGLGLLSLAALAAYVVIAGVPAPREMALLAAMPSFLIALSFKASPQVMLALLTTGLSFSARYRPFGIGYHQGGAELAIAPLDFPLLGLILLAAPRMRSANFRREILTLLRPLARPLALFLVLHLLSIVVATDRGLALLELLRIVKMVVLIVALAIHASSPKGFRLVVTCLLVVTLIQGGLACIQWASGESVGLGFLGEHSFWNFSIEEGTVGRAGGTLGHANALACFLGLLTPLALSVALAPTSRQHRILAAMALLAGMAGSFVTFSRAVWLALPAGLLLVLILQIRWNRPALRKLGPALLGLLILVAALAALNADTIALRFSRIWSTSFQFRVSTARTASNMIRAKPLFGVGGNNYEVVSDAYLPAEDGSFKPENARIVVHNILLLYAAELGLTGLAAFLILLLALLRLTWRVAGSRGKEAGPVGLGILGGLVALLIQSQFGWLFKYDPIFTLFWFMVGLVLAAGKLDLHQEQTGVPARQADPWIDHPSTI